MRIEALFRDSILAPLALTLLATADLGQALLCVKGETAMGALLDAGGEALRSALTSLSAHTPDELRGKRISFWRRLHEQRTTRAAVAADWVRAPR